MTRDRGFVLVNALVLVAALASVAVLLLARSEAGQARLQSGLAADQLTLNLDAFDALAMTMLTQDSNGIDHPGEDWAKSIEPVDLAHGQVSGQLQDLQGRFNVNWIAIPGNTMADEAFDVLLFRLGIAPETGSKIRDFLNPGGPSDRSGWLQRDPPLAPPGGAILDIGQLFEIPGVSRVSLERLRPHITALPGMTQLNVNTATAEVLAAFFPEVPQAALARLMAARRQQPFPSATAFLTQIGLATPPDETDSDGGDGGGEAPTPTEAEEAARQRQAALEALISVGSDWFEVQASAQFRNQTAQRRTLLKRTGVPVVVDVAWRISNRP
ncbi:type II secretion system minor pseudopilin GspK [Tropicibacter oceani]|uniref:Type II secretion system protein K n=1 Tax=Tropicibacter oceani TaxID=3058420 RepID=A0ABY8QMQ5_9RHOB|nr:type II secretion system minor pseudopilin GspK [Tropicibacter oceani]WGW05914.1 type II secretion system minor pseudopilin GspK [Tropicibacter oceani]